MRRMLISAKSQELRVAIVQNGLLVDLDIERPDIEQNKSNIYWGRISSIEPSLNAVFVDYGRERHGFLPVKEIAKEYFNLNDDNQLRHIDIQKALRIGQEILVQVDKEERGTKGAALTTFISLAGSYLVLMPNNPRAGGISRRIEGDEREELRERLNNLNIPEGMGIIIRTAGVTRNTEELQWDLAFLLRYWDAIKQATNLKKAPYLIHEESDVIIRAIRDNLRHDVAEIIIDDPTAFDRAKNYLEQVRPDFASRIKLYSESLPLFSYLQVERQIEMAYQREVHLPSGGSIFIDLTEALVSIDINSAKATRGGNIEETALHTNLEAAEEIARQLRIRDIGGLVVIDFIDMVNPKNQRDVENRLRDSLQMDRARIQIGRISRFGLLEMSRQRLRSSLNRSIHNTCPRCNGQGSVRSVESLAHSIVHLIQEQAVKMHNIEIQVQVPIDVASYILNENRATLSTIEKETNVQVIIIPNEHLESPNYSIKHVKIDPHSKSPASYKLVKLPKLDGVTSSKDISTKAFTEPAINEFLATTGIKPDIAPHKQKTAQSGLMKRILGAVFGAAPENNPPKKSEQPRSETPSSTEKPEQRHTKKPVSTQPQRERRQSSNTSNSRSSSNNSQNQGQGRRHPHSRQQSREQLGHNDNNPHNRRDEPSSQRRHDEPKHDHHRREEHQDNQHKREPLQEETHITPVNMPNPVEKPVVVQKQTPVTPAAPPVATTAPPAMHLVKEPSPLETATTTLTQVRSRGDHTQEEIQARIKEQLKEIRSETTAVVHYGGLGGNGEALQQVKTKQDA